MHDILRKLIIIRNRKSVLTAIYLLIHKTNVFNAQFFCTSIIWKSESKKREGKPPCNLGKFQYTLQKGPGPSHLQVHLHYRRWFPFFTFFQTKGQSDTSTQIEITAYRNGISQPVSISAAFNPQFYLVKDEEQIHWQLVRKYFLPKSNIPCVIQI